MVVLIVDQEQVFGEYFCFENIDEDLNDNEFSEIGIEFFICDGD